MINPVSSSDEWSPLREVIIGVGGGQQSYDYDLSFVLFFWDNLKHMRIQGKDAGSLQLGDSLPIFEKAADELAEDIAGFVATLRKRGVVVHRPAPVIRDHMVASPHWSSTGYSALNVRDQAIIIDQTIVETAPHVRGRLFENDFLKPVFQQYFEVGSRWISMPRPALARGSLDASYFDGDPQVAKLIGDDTAEQIAGLNFEIVIDGANCLRFGDDILVNVANRNHELGLAWLRREFPNKRFHRLHAMADNHIDSIVAPLREGTVVLRSETYRSALPKFFEDWEIVIPPADTLDDATGADGIGAMPFLASHYIDLNVLSLDPQTVVVNSESPRLCDFISGLGFEVLPVRHRHRRYFAGGFHCFTLDTVRRV